MARLLGYLGNHYDRAACAAELESAALAVPTGGVDGWGVGTLVSGEALLKRKPRGDAAMRVGTLLSAADGDLTLVRLRAPGPSPRTIENTQPFRFRQWLYADLSPDDQPDERVALRAAIPEFLAANVRGDTVSELRFHVALSALFDEGRVDDPTIDRAAVMAAMRVAIARSDSAAGATRPLVTMLAWPQGIVTFCRAMTVSHVRRQGVRDCPACRRDRGESATVDHETLRYVMISDTQATESGWRTLGRGTLPEAGIFLSVTRELDVQEHPV